MSLKFIKSFGCMICHDNFFHPSSDHFTPISVWTWWCQIKVKSIQSVFMMNDDDPDYAFNFKLEIRK